MDTLNLASRPSWTSLVEQLLQASHIAKGKSKSCSALSLTFSHTASKSSLIQNTKTWLFKQSEKTLSNKASLDQKHNKAESKLPQKSYHN